MLLLTLLIFSIFNQKGSLIHENGQEFSQRSGSHSLHLLIAPVDPIGDLSVHFLVLLWSLHQVDSVFCVIDGLDGSGAFIADVDLLGAD